MTEYIPGTYAKGADRREAKNAKQAVALAFDGYKLVESEPTQVAEAPAAADKPEERVETPVPGPRGPRPPQESNKP